MQTEIGKLFLKLLDKHFNKQHGFYKIFNRNNVKISHCCASNISTLISSHKKKITNNNEETKSLCNCRIKINCPVENECCQTNVIYQASIIASNNTTKLYVGSTKRNFKTRFNEHKVSFPKINKTKAKKNVLN